MDLRSKYPKDTFQYLVTTDGNQLFTGTGSLITSLLITNITSSNITTSYATESIISALSITSSGLLSNFITASTITALSMSLGYINNGVVQLVRSDGTIREFFGNTDATRGLQLRNAQNAAVAGDTIYVYGNTFITASLGKDGVNWWFAPNTTLSASNVPAFSDVAGTMTFKIGGFGNITSDPPFDATILLTQSSSFFIIQANEIASTVDNGDASSPCIHIQNSGSIILDANIVRSVSYDAIWNGGGQLYANVKIAQGVDNAFESSGPGSSYTNLVCDEMIGGNAAISLGGGNSVIRANRLTTMNGLGTPIITNTIFGSVPSCSVTCPIIPGLVQHVVGSLRIIGALIGDSSRTDIPIDVQAPGLVLENCTIDASNSSARYAITSSTLPSASLTIIGGLSYNKAIAPGVTLLNYSASTYIGTALTSSYLSVATSSAPPSNSASVAAWVSVNVHGSIFKLPLYQ